MRVTDRRQSVGFFIVLGCCLVALAVTLNVGWILLNWREVALLVLGIVFFIAIIGGLVLNTTFLVREIRRNEQHDSFINAVTHELKTPIASIRLYLETLQKRHVDEARRREFYDIMLADSDRLLHTVEQALRAGRMDNRRRHINPGLIDMGEMVRQCLQVARQRYHLGSESLQYEETLARGERPTVWGDADELQAAVTNLLDNAIKYSDKEVRVFVQVAMPDIERVEVNVTDRGIGIPRNQLTRIFKRFYRVPGGQGLRVKGTGLGLFIVRSIVKRHGGKAFAASQGEGCGSTFTIQLPKALER